jgi:hypothetical protein
VCIDREHDLARWQFTGAAFTGLLASHANAISTDGKASW